MTAHFKRGPHLPVFQGCQGKERKKKREINQAFTHSQTAKHKRKRKKTTSKRKRNSEKKANQLKRAKDVRMTSYENIFVHCWMIGTPLKEAHLMTLTPYMFLQHNHVPPQTLMKLTKQLQHQEKTSGAHFRSQQVARHHNIKESVKT